MWLIVLCIVGSAITSTVITKILATHYFKIVDGYVDEVCKKTKDFVDSTIHKLK